MLKILTETNRNKSNNKSFSTRFYNNTSDSRPLPKRELCVLFICPSINAKKLRRLPAPLRLLTPQKEPPGKYDRLIFSQEKSTTELSTKSTAIASDHQSPRQYWSLSSSARSSLKHLNQRRPDHSHGSTTATRIHHPHHIIFLHTYWWRTTTTNQSEIDVLLWTLWLYHCILWIEFNTSINASIRQ